MAPDCFRGAWLHCNASTFMLKTVLSLNQQSGPFKRSSFVLFWHRPSLLLQGSIPFIFTTAIAWESELN